MKVISQLFDALIVARFKKSTRDLRGRIPPAVACFDCGMRHQLPADVRQAMASAEDFFGRHLGHAVNWYERPGFAGLYRDNADVKQALQSAQTCTVTNLHSLGSSATAGWQGAVIDNTSNLYLDFLLMVVADFANTAPANSKALFIFAYGGLESGTYTYPCTGSEGTITLSDVTANPTAVRRVGTLPYLVQDAVIQSVPFSIGVAFGGAAPPYWGPVIINHSGAALAASGNTVKYRGVYLTSI